MEWQSIKTVTREIVLVYGKDDEGNAFITKAYLHDGLWWEDFTSHESICELPFEPTHWMPLPEPPEAK